MRALLPFFDDSTLLFAAKLSRVLTANGIECVVAEQSGSVDYAGVSDRQKDAILGEGSTILTLPPDFLHSGDLSQFDLVSACRTTKEIRAYLEKNPAAEVQRPCFIAFQPGLEFTPEKGFFNRFFYDSIFFNTPEHVSLYQASNYCRDRQYIGWGHPYFTLPTTRNTTDEGDIVFFAQSISPPTYNGRKHIVDMLIAMAEAYPTRRVVLKLRHMPDENTGHVHTEKFPYPGLLPSTAPGNMAITASSMEEALSGASYAITCTSTAAMDAISAGVATAVYTSYVDFMHDPLSGSAKRFFSGSGIVRPLGDILDLNIQHADDSWVKDHFRSEAFLCKEIILAVTQHKANQ
jgi:hypothetical protein